MSESEVRISCYIVILSLLFEVSMAQIQFPYEKYGLNDGDKNNLGENDRWIWGYIDPTNRLQTANKNQLEPNDKHGFRGNAATEPAENDRWIWGFLDPTYHPTILPTAKKNELKPSINQRLRHNAAAKLVEHDHWVLEFLDPNNQPTNKPTNQLRTTKKILLGPSLIQWLRDHAASEPTENDYWFWAIVDPTYHPTNESTNELPTATKNQLEPSIKQRFWDNAATEPAEHDPLAGEFLYPTNIPTKQLPTAKRILLGPSENDHLIGEFLDPTNYPTNIPTNQLPNAKKILLGPSLKQWLQDHPASEQTENDHLFGEFLYQTNDLTNVPTNQLPTAKKILLGPSHLKQWLQDHPASEQTENDHLVGEFLDLTNRPTNTPTNQLPTAKKILLGPSQLKQWLQDHPATEPTEHGHLVGEFLDPTNHPTNIPTNQLPIAKKSQLAPSVTQLIRKPTATDPIEGDHLVGEFLDPTNHPTNIPTNQLPTAKTNQIGPSVIQWIREHTATDPNGNDQWIWELLDPTNQPTNQTTNQLPTDKQEQLRPIIIQWLRNHTSAEPIGNDQWFWGYVQPTTNKIPTAEKNQLDTSGGHSLRGKGSAREPTTGSTPPTKLLVTSDKIKEFDPPYVPPKHDFSAAGKRISEIKCDEYISELESRYKLGLRTMECVSVLKRAKLDDPKHGLDISAIVDRSGKPSTFPHMGAIGWQATAGPWVFKCGGSLISSKFVLTASHCSRASVFDTNIADPVPKIVRLGHKNFVDMNTNGVEPTDAKIINILLHPMYRPPKKYYDIALMELEDHVEFTKHIQPACMWTRFDTTSLGNEAYLTGWGRVETTGQTTSPELQIAGVHMINSTICDQLLKPSCSHDWCGVRDNQICASKLAGVDACQVNSGGPLQVPIPHSMTSEGYLYYIVGVTSSDIGCAQPDLPAIYSRVSMYLDWIEPIVWPMLLA